jgi:hypothetical protein
MVDVGDAFGQLTSTNDGPTLAGAVTAIVTTLSAWGGTSPIAEGGGDAASMADPVGTSDPSVTGAAGIELLDALVLLHWVQAELSVAEHTLIESARRAGVSWQAIAPALGVASRQAAERRFLRLAPAVAPTAGPSTVDVDAGHEAMTGTRQGRTGSGTRDGRVRAERDRRAGQRAVARWANDNTADLRRLAGQITAIPDLGQTASTDIDRLHEALADTDAVALPELPANTRRHLADHPDLADQIDAVTARTVEVRDDTQRRRDRFDG